MLRDTIFRRDSRSGTSHLVSVLLEQRVGLLVVDAEFADHLSELPAGIDVVLTRTDGATRRATLEHLIASSPLTALPRRPRRSRLIVLTSGTSGAPNGAQHPEPPGLASPGQGDLVPPSVA